MNAKTGTIELYLAHFNEPDDGVQNRLSFYYHQLNRLKHVMELECFKATKSTVCFHSMDVLLIFI